MEKMFKCSECRKNKRLSELSAFSLNLAGTRDPEVALLALTPGNLVCAYCDDESLESYIGDDSIPGEAAARNEVEAWELSGTTLSEGERIARWLNY
jgi:hypothetical protein